MKDNGEEFRGEANEEGKAGRGVVHAEAFWDAGGMDAAGRGPWAETKKEDAPDGTAVILPGHKAHKDGTAAEAGDRRAEQAIKDKAEQAKELEITLKMADAAPLHEGAGKDKGGVKEGRSSGHSRDHEDSDPPSDVTEAFTRAFGAPDVGSAEVEGERWVSLAPSPFASNENAPLTRVPYLSQPVTAGAEEPFPAIVQNFIGFFTYMRSQRNANEHGAGAPGRMQVVNTERGEAVWPAGKKEGGENRSDHGGSSGEGQKRGDEEDEIIFYKTA
jgi:hypothetical protein